ncbi:hypothetical protein BCV72DRAFT_251006 [Rhizopus microsporus var. microsporus]|nr:hypothetical protein BCV72DRAFT_251006 [Rhizopus microsporus var. microsporus]
MLLYGEFGFTLLELKPCTLVEFRDIQVTRLYCEQVIVPALHSLEKKTLDYFIISNQVKTPESDLQGALLIYHKDHQGIIATFDHDTTVPEERMAEILDYPGHLPSSEQEVPTMKTVIYLHDRKTTQVALTTFAIQTHQTDAMISHFQRYKHACKERLDIDLSLIVQ